MPEQELICLPYILEYENYNELSDTNFDKSHDGKSNFKTENIEDYLNYHLKMKPHISIDEIAKDLGLQEGDKLYNKVYDLFNKPKSSKKKTKVSLKKDPISKSSIKKRNRRNRRNHKNQNRGVSVKLLRTRSLSKARSKTVRTGGGNRKSKKRKKSKRKRHFKGGGILDLLKILGCKSKPRDIKRVCSITKLIKIAEGNDSGNNNSPELVMYNGNVPAVDDRRRYLFRLDFLPPKSNDADGPQDIIRLFFKVSNFTKKLETYPIDSFKPKCFNSNDCGVYIYESNIYQELKKRVVNKKVHLNNKILKIFGFGITEIGDIARDFKFKPKICYNKETDKICESYLPNNENIIPYELKIVGLPLDKLRLRLGFCQSNTKYMWENVSYNISEFDPLFKSANSYKNTDVTPEGAIALIESLYELINELYDSEIGFVHYDLHGSNYLVRKITTTKINSKVDFEIKLFDFDKSLLLEEDNTTISPTMKDFEHYLHHFTSKIAGSEKEQNKFIFKLGAVFDFHRIFCNTSFSDKGEPEIIPYTYMWEIFFYYNKFSGSKRVSDYLFNKFYKLAHNPVVHPKLPEKHKESIRKYTQLIDKHKEPIRSKFSPEEQQIIINLFPVTLDLSLNYKLTLPWHFTLWLIFTEEKDPGKPGARVLITPVEPTPAAEANHLDITPVEPTPVEPTAVAPTPAAAPTPVAPNHVVRLRGALPGQITNV